MILRDDGNDDSGAATINFASTSLSTVVRRSSTVVSSEAGITKDNDNVSHDYPATDGNDDDNVVMPVSQATAVTVRRIMEVGEGERERDGEKKTLEKAGYI